MNEQDIQSMEPGRELDALVASEVLNITKDSVDQEMFNTLWSTGLFHYSSHISDAWKVVEKMKENNWFISLSDDVYRSKWSAMFYWDVNKIFTEVISESAPEAICKAALIAVMESETDE